MRMKAFKNFIQFLQHFGIPLLLLVLAMKFAPEGVMFFSVFGVVNIIVLEDMKLKLWLDFSNLH